MHDVRGDNYNKKAMRSLTLISEMRESFLLFRTDFRDTQKAARRFPAFGMSPKLRFRGERLYLPSQLTAWED